MAYNPFYNIENPQLMGYEYAWVNFMKNNEVDDTSIPSVILDSWKKCRDNNVSYANTLLPENSDRIDPLTSESLVQEGGAIIEDILANLESDCFYGIITDKTGRKLFGLGTQTDESSDRLKDISIIESFAENQVGTNCFSVVAHTKKSFCVAGAQHYFEILHKYAGYAAPIFDDHNELAGMVGFYTLADRMEIGRAHV